MVRVASEVEDRASRAVRDRLIDLVAIETRIVESSASWSDTLRGHPEVASIIDRMRVASISRRAALEPRLATAAGGRRPAVSNPPTIVRPPSASEALRRAAEAAFTAALACETAYQAARLSYDDDTCELLEAFMGDHVATVIEARDALPHTVAHELRGQGVDCACRCPMCSIGACGCVRATLAAVHVAWSGEEPPRASGVTLLSPPRPDSQLAEAGLGEGDRVIAVDGQEVGCNKEIQAALRRHPVGHEVRLDVHRRSGERLQLMVRRVG